MVKSFSGNASYSYLVTEPSFGPKSIRLPMAMHIILMCSLSPGKLGFSLTLQKYPEKKERLATRGDSCVSLQNPFILGVSQPCKGSFM